MVEYRTFDKKVKRVIYRRESNHISAIVFLSFLGALFSGYLSYTTLFKGFCFLKEGCMNVLGLPSCVYGFLFFFLIFILSFVSMFSRIHFSTGIRLISVIGILFSGIIGFYELLFAANNIFNYVFTLILPACIYGFILYLVIYILS